VKRLALVAVLLSGCASVPEAAPPESPIGVLGGEARARSTEGLSLVFAADGKTLTACAGYGRSVYEVETGRLLRTLSGVEPGFRSSEVSPDGALVVVVDDLDWGRVREVATGSVVSRFPPDAWPVSPMSIGNLGPERAPRFSPDGRRIAWVGRMGDVSVVDAATGRSVLQARLGAREVEFSPRADMIVASGPGFVDLVELATGRTQRVHDSSGWETCVTCFSVDGKQLAMLSPLAGTTVELGAGKALLDLGSGSGPPITPAIPGLELALPPDFAPVCVAFSLDASRLIVGGQKASWVFSTRSSSVTATLRGAAGDVQRVAFSPDGALVATVADGRVVLWDAATGEQRRVLENRRTPPVRLAFSPDGTTLAAIRASGSLTLVDVATRKKRVEVHEHSPGEKFQSMSFAPDGTFVTGGGNGLMTLRDPANGAERLRFSAWSGDPVEVAFSPDGQRIAAVSPGQRALAFWDPSSGLLEGTIPVPFEFRGSKLLVFSREGDFLSLGTPIALGRLSLVSGEVERLSTRADWPFAVSADGRLFAGQCWAETTGWRTRVSNMRADFTRVFTREEHERATTALAFSPDGSLLAEGDRAGTIRLRSVSAAGAPRKLPFPGRSCSIRSLAFSPGGDLLAAGYDDGSILLWAVK
jgi:WD40 repeat protein